MEHQSERVDQRQHPRRRKHQRSRHRVRNGQQHDSAQYSAAGVTWQAQSGAELLVRATHFLAPDPCVNQPDAPVHGSGLRLESARDEGGLEQSGECQHLREVALDIVGRAILASRQESRPAGRGVARPDCRGRSNRRRRMSRHPETPWPEIVENDRRLGIRGGFQVARDGRRRRYPRSVESRAASRA